MKIKSLPICIKCCCGFIDLEIVPKCECPNEKAKINAWKDMLGVKE